VSGVLRQLLQRRDHDRLHLIDADGGRPARPGLVHQSIQPLGEKAPPPLVDRVRDARHGFSELDLALLDAPQTTPRAPWSRIGRALGVDAATAARHWERLRAAGLSWITAHDAAKTATVAFVEVRCRPGSLASVSAAAALLPWVFNVDETAGDFDLFLGVPFLFSAATGPDCLMTP
jgi:hypothetical protein